MKRDAMPASWEVYDISTSMIVERANVHTQPHADVLFRFDKRTLDEFAQELIACARGAAWPLPPPLPWHHPDPGAAIRQRAKKPRPGALTPVSSEDTKRLNFLELAGGHVVGSDCGRPAFRLFGSDKWFPSLREAVDDFAVEKNSESKF